MLELWLQGLFDELDSPPLDGETKPLAAAQFMETPVHTFTLPDLDIYEGGIIHCKIYMKVW